MTKEEAIKDIEENILPFVGGKSLRMAIDALRQPERKTGEWIPVTEKLPEKTQLCLVTEKTVVGLETCTRCFNKRNDGGFWSGWGHTDVIAWMPLPEPYKEEQDEER